MSKERKCFISNEFDVIDHNIGNIERYEYTENLNAFIEWFNYTEDVKDRSKEVQKLLDEKALDTIREMPEYNEWSDEEPERYEIPIMNALYYFPDFCSFEEADRYKPRGATTLLYDNELERWAIGMTGGGMDLSPELLDTFINMGSGVPSNIAGSISLNYSAHVSDKRHQENCNLLAKSYIDEADRCKNKAKELTSK